MKMLRDMKMLVVVDVAGNEENMAVCVSNSTDQLKQYALETFGEVAVWEETSKGCYQAIIEDGSEYDGNICYLINDIEVV